VSDPQRLVATASQTVGPFFHCGLAPLANGQLVGPIKQGEPIELFITVTDGDGRPVPDAVVELWQGPGPVSAFGRMPTGEDGTCVFTTMTPDAGAEAPLRARYINLCLFARGLLRQLHTRIYFAGDPALSADPVLALIPAERRATLLATADAADPGRWRFHVRLQGPEETVFFDV
jgi:protocatechuate 3,4-dioxygenase alpha subunit